MSRGRGPLDRWIACSQAPTPDTLGPIMRARAFRFASMSLLVAAAVACGSRTGLFLDEEAFGPNPIDGGPPLLDGGRRDAARDVVEIEDAIPPLDVTPPQDVNNIDCAEAGT